MDKYRKVAKAKDTTVRDEAEIRVTAVGSVSAYVTRAAEVYNEIGKSEIIITGSGNAITKAVQLAEVVKRRFKGLHQITNLRTQEFVDEYEPLEEGLDKVIDTRTVSVIDIKLSKEPLDTSDKGYQPPIDESQVTEYSKEEMTRGRGRGGAGRGRGKGRGKSPKGKGKGKGSPKGKGKSKSKSPKGKGKSKGEGKNKGGSPKGKSRGKGKGNSESPKGKGKGKGRVDSPKGKGKGKGKDYYNSYDNSKGKGKPKGVNYYNDWSAGRGGYGVSGYDKWYEDRSYGQGGYGTKGKAKGGGSNSWKY